MSKIGYNDIATSVLPIYHSDFVVENRVNLYRGNVICVKDFPWSKKEVYRLVAIRRLGNFLLVQNATEAALFDHRNFKRAVVAEGLEATIGTGRFGKLLRFVSITEATEDENTLQYEQLSNPGDYLRFLSKHKGYSIVCGSYNGNYLESFFFKRVFGCKK